MQNKNEIRNAVRERYHQLAENSSAIAGGCCSPESSSCCKPQGEIDLQALKLGYSADDLTVVPEGANLGLGCGNPQAIAMLKAGETVVDLGSGAGFDVFLAARQVGETGQVIGVDMTPSMINKARANAEKINLQQVEFRLGEIENLPVANDLADVIISNCVINLSPEKPKVFREAFRVLKQGGRLAVSDVVALQELPAHIKADMALYSGCISGASTIPELTEMLTEAGFTGILIQPKDESKDVIRDWDVNNSITDYIISASIEAVKP
ncbi:arsenite methyltransferase [Gaoshiqia sp. Z1-71]|uniref:arsenite methyltransferase n=1 Tax=Gaoshiqia hydrogeniformans TaxID=3290090 RepID=UPI003BF91EA6